MAVRLRGCAATAGQLLRTAWQKLTGDPLGGTTGLAEADWPTRAQWWTGLAPAADTFSNLVMARDFRFKRLSHRRLRRSVRSLPSTRILAILPASWRHHFGDGIAPSVGLLSASGVRVSPTAACDSFRSLPSSFLSWHSSSV